MKTIKQIGDISGKRVLVRVDFNVPIENGIVIDPYRIEQSLDTIHFLRDYGAKIILISHRGKSDESLSPVAEYMKRYFPVQFVKDITDGEALRAVEGLRGGEVLLLENLRSNPGEEKNDQLFAEALARHGDIYVNEAFSASHREHASIVTLPSRLPSCCGLQFARELEHLSLALNPTHPFVFILGGAKFSTKLPLLKKYLEIADTVFVGGALVNNFYVAQGLSVGKSLVDEGEFGIPALLSNQKLIIPKNVVVTDGMQTVTKEAHTLTDNDVIVDIDKAEVEALRPMLNAASLILWNGPLGKTGNDDASKVLIELLKEVNGKTIIGGGDTATLLSGRNDTNAFTFVSTGGGATLQFLAEGTLPGIDALKSL
jgi:phosphoglycerate kinase